MGLCPLLKERTRNYMTKLTKKIISFVMTAVLGVSLLVPVSVSAAASDVSGWGLVLSGGADGGVTVDNTQAASGTSSLKLWNNTMFASNVYVMSSASVSFEQGKVYEIQFQLKSKNSTSIILCENWDKRWSLTPFGKTFDWTNFEFSYTPAKDKAGGWIGFILEGETDGVWVDDFIVREKGTTENLISNSTFEPAGGQVITSGTEALDDSLESIYNKITTSDTFSAEDMIKVRGAFRYMPVYRAENIQIDGNSSDWDNYPSMDMPTLPTQYQTYMNDGKGKDIKAKCKFAQDDDYFYFMIEVEDDKYVYKSTEADYWQGDSIQLALSKLSEPYGSEIGLAHNPDTNESDIYGTVIEQVQHKDNIKIKTSQSGNKTVYEVAIPWYAKFGTKPEKFLFDFLVNDNDGDGRRYAMELTPGIAEGKTNAKFPILEIMEGSKDWYGWIEANREGYVDEEQNFDLYIVNEGPAKTFTVENPIDGSKEEVKVAANSGIRKRFNQTYNEKGTYTMSLTVNDGNEDNVFTSDMTVDFAPPDEDDCEALAVKLEKNAKILQELIDECEALGIPTDYEQVSQWVLNRYITYVRSDAAQKDFSRVWYTEESTDIIFEEAKANLEAYIAGDKEAFDVPHYVNGKTRFEGTTAYSIMEYKGEMLEQPFYSVGYGHFQTAKNDIAEFNKFGATNIQYEVGVSQSLSKTSTWNATSYGEPDAEWSVTEDDKAEGEKAMKLVFNSAVKSNRYSALTQTVAVTPGKTYTYRMKLKGNVSNGFITANNWDNRFSVVGEYPDWTTVETTYTAPTGVTSTVLRFNNDGPTDGIMIDDVYFGEGDSGENLVSDGGFEKYGELAYVYDPNATRVREVKDLMQKCEENNVAYSFLISPHYMMQEVIDAYDIGSTGGGFSGYNMGSDIAKELIGMHIEGILGDVKDSPALNNVCLTNEPSFQVKGCGDFYLADWHKYLEEEYNGDISELNYAYKTNYSSFDEIDYEYGDTDFAKTMDYKRFNDKVFGEIHTWIAEKVKEVVPGVPVHSKICGYVSYTSGSHYARMLNNGTGYKEHKDYSDLMGNDYLNFYGSNAPATKNMWYDYLRSVKDVPSINTEDHVVSDYSDNFTLIQEDHSAQDIYQGAIHGRYLTTIWELERSNDKSNAFFGSISKRPGGLVKVGHVALDLNRLAYQITALKDEEAEIGIVYPDASTLFRSSMMNSAYEAYTAALYNGHNARFIVDWEPEKMFDYKIIIVPNAPYLQEDTLNCLNQYVSNGGTVVIIGEDDVLKYTDKGLEQDPAVVENIKNNSIFVNWNTEVTHTDNQSSPELGKIFRDVLKDKNMYYVSIVDAETEEPVYEIEYNVGVYDGKVLVNIDNYLEDKDVKIYLGDKLVEKAVELRSGEEVGSVVTAKQLQPIMLEIETDNTFFDTYGHWAENDIVKLKDKGIAYGVNDSRYKPNDKTTRAQFLALLLRAAGFTANAYGGEAPDVAAEDWFAKDVSAAAARGIINAGEDFRPNDNITREEMCEMLVKCYEAKKGAVSEIADLGVFTDADTISGNEYVGKALGKGLMYGYDDGSFGAKGFATRAEAAVVTERFLEK